MRIYLSRRRKRRARADRRRSMPPRLAPSAHSAYGKLVDSSAARLTRPSAAIKLAITLRVMVPRHAERDGYYDARILRRKIPAKPPSTGRELAIPLALAQMLAKPTQRRSPKKGQNPLASNGLASV